MPGTVAAPTDTFPRHHPTPRKKDGACAPSSTRQYPRQPPDDGHGQFGTAARYTGASLGYQGATLLGAGFTPVILASLQAAAGGGTGLVAAFMIGLAVLSAVFILLAKESKDRDLSTYEH